MEKRKPVRFKVISKRPQKPEALLERIILSSTKENDIVLDFFAGSGTTGVVAHKLNRRYILCEQIDTQIDVQLERLIKVVSGNDNGTLALSLNWQGGGSFVYCELAKLNQNYVEQIQKSQNDEELSAVWYNILQSGFISSYVNPKEINPEAEDFNALSFDEKKQLFIELLDGYIKSISLKIPLFENDELKNKIDVWDINPSLDNEGNWKSESDDSIIDEEGYFRKYASQLDEQDEYERINGEDTNAPKSKEEAEREREYYIEKFSHLNADTFETVAICEKTI